MKKCNSCGKEFENGAFCPDCGGKLEDVIETNNEGTSTFCPNCGSKMSATAEFCSNCGYSKSGAKAASAKSGFKMPKINSKLLVAIPVAIVIIAVLMFAKNLLFGSIGKGADAIYNGTNNAIVALAKNEIVDIVNNTLTNGSIEMNMSEMPTGVPVNGKVNAKMYFGNNKYALTFDGEINDTAFKNNIIYIDAEKVVAKIPVAFGDKKIYGLDIKNLQDSWLMSLMNYREREMLQKSLDNQEKIKGLNQDVLKKDITGLYKDALNTLKSSVKKNLKFENENSTVTFGDKDVKVLKVTTKVSGEQANKIYKDLLKWAKANKNIKTFLKKYYFLYEMSLNSSSDADTIYENLISKIDAEIERVDGLNTENAETIKLQFCIAKDTKQLVEVKVISDNQEYTFIGGPDWKDPIKVSISDGKYTDVAYVQSKDGNDYTYTLTNNGNKVGAIKWNKKTGEFSIKDSNGSYNVTGNVKLGDKTTLVIDNVNLGFMSVKPNVSFIIKKKDSVPGAPGKFDDILKMEESEVQELGKEIAERVSDKFNLGSLMSSIW